MISRDKKKKQLEMDPGTASHRLRGDIMFSFLVRLGYKCFRCGEDLTRKSFSIDHVKPWLDSGDPVEAFFNLNNVSFSHKKCNYELSRGSRKYFSEEELRMAKRKQNREYRKRHKETCKELRREHYLRTGK